VNNWISFIKILIENHKVGRKPNFLMVTQNFRRQLEHFWFKSSRVERGAVSIGCPEPVFTRVKINDVIITGEFTNSFILYFRSLTNY